MPEKLIHASTCDECESAGRNIKIKSNRMPIKPTAILGLKVNICVASASLLVGIETSVKALGYLPAINWWNANSIKYSKMPVHAHRTHTYSYTQFATPEHNFVGLFFIAAIMPIIIISYGCRVCDSWKITWIFAIHAPHHHHPIPVYIYGIAKSDIDARSALERSNWQIVAHASRGVCAVCHQL